MSLRLDRVRDGLGPFVLYPLLALLSFPTLGAITGGPDGIAYAHDVFDLPRTGVGADWLAHGPTLWNAHLTSGNSLLAGHLSPYALDVGLALVLGPFAAMAITWWLTASVAGVAMHLFLRDGLRLTTAAAVAGATIFTFAFWHAGYGFSVALLPLGLWLLDRAFDATRHRWRYVLAAILAAGFAFHHGIAQVVVLIAAVQLAYLALARNQPSLVRRVATWAAIWGLGLALYAPVLATQLVMLPGSHRTVWDLQALVETRPLPAIRDWLEHYSAVFLGVPIGPTFGRSPAVYGTYFLGAIGLPALVLGLVASHRDRRRWFLVGLLVAIPLLDLLAVLATPLQEGLGVLKTFQFVRIRHVLPFALAANAAIGIDVVVRALLDGRQVLPTARWRRAVVALAFLPVIATLAAAVRQVWQVWQRQGQSSGDDIRALGWVLAAGALLLGISVVVTVLTALVRAHGGPVRRLGPFLVVVLVLLAGERVLHEHGERFLSSGLGTYTGSLARTPAQRFLLAQPGIKTDRVLTFGDHANRQGAEGLLQVDGYESMYPRAYHAFFGALTAPQLETDPNRWTYFHRWGNRAYAFGPGVDPELVALSGVRWLYVKGDDMPTVPGIVERFRDRDVAVYEVPGVLPRAFITEGPTILPDAAAVAAALSTASTDDLRRVAYVVAGPDINHLRQAVPASEAGVPAGSATIVDYTPDRVAIDLDARAPGLLVLTDVYAPGWIAEVDGTPTPVIAVDGAFRGVSVDEGTAQVVFRYVPLFTYAGFIVAAAAIVVTLALAWALRRRDR